MAVSGTYDFNLDIDEVIQEATEMIGGEDTLGHEPASAIPGQDPAGRMDHDRTFGQRCLLGEASAPQQFQPPRFPALCEAPYQKP